MSEAELPGRDGGTLADKLDSVRQVSELWASSACPDDSRFLLPRRHSFDGTRLNRNTLLIFLMAGRIFKRSVF